MANSTSTIFTMDIYSKYFGKESTEASQVRVGRITAIVAFIIAAIVAPALGQLDQAFQFIQEYTGWIQFFERDDSAGAMRYIWRTDRYADLPVGEWSRFVDADGDGDQDLFSEAPYSFIRWYRNDGSATSARCTSPAPNARPRSAWQAGSARAVSAATSAPNSSRSARALAARTERCTS